MRVCTLLTRLPGNRDAPNSLLFLCHKYFKNKFKTYIKLAVTGLLRNIYVKIIAKRSQKNLYSGEIGLICSVLKKG